MSVYILPEEFCTPQDLWSFGLEFIEENVEKLESHCFAVADVIFDFLFLEGALHSSPACFLSNAKTFKLVFDQRKVHIAGSFDGDSFLFLGNQFDNVDFLEKDKPCNVLSASLNFSFQNCFDAQQWQDKIKKNFLCVSDFFFAYWDSNENNAQGIWVNEIPEFCDYAKEEFLYQLATVARNERSSEIVVFSPFKLSLWVKSYFDKRDKFIDEAFNVLAKNSLKARKTSLIYPDFAEIEDRNKYWKGITFRHVTEVAIAKELDSRSVFFFANPACRLNEGSDRKTREPDFVVYHNGRWGILELDGSSHNGRHSHDQQRDRLFKKHGILVVEHFDSTLPPKQIVDEFLAILEVA